MCDSSHYGNIQNSCEERQSVRALLKKACFNRRCYIIFWLVVVELVIMVHLVLGVTFYIEFDNKSYMYNGSTNYSVYQTLNFVLQEQIQFGNFVHFVLIASVLLMSVFDVMEYCQFACGYVCERTGTRPDKVNTGKWFYCKWFLIFYR